MDCKENLQCFHFKTLSHILLQFQGFTFDITFIHRMKVTTFPLLISQTRQLIWTVLQLLMILYQLPRNPVDSI